MLKNRLSSRSRFVVGALLMVLPQKVKHQVARRVLGWDLHPTARIGLSVVAAKHVRMGAAARIGALNMVKGIEELDMGDGSLLGSFLWISSPPLTSGQFPNAPARWPALRLGREAAITGRHLIDCSDTVTLDDFATLAGYWTQILTHSIDIHASVQRTAPVHIGQRSMVFTRCTLLSGAVVPDRCIVAGGALVADELPSSRMLYGGVPAKPIRELDDGVRYLSRTRGFVV